MIITHACLILTPVYCKGCILDKITQLCLNNGVFMGDMPSKWVSPIWVCSSDMAGSEPVNGVVHRLFRHAGIRVTIFLSGGDDGV